MAGRLQPFRVIGHRGAAAVVPENTVASFARALSDGADALETDVHATEDGVPVCSHDPDGGRMAGKPRLIRETSLRELQSWDAGWGFTGGDGARPFVGGGLCVPTLEEVLGAFPGVPLSIDLKADDPALAAEAVNVVRRAGSEDRVTVGSFHARMMAAVRRAGYAGPSALTAGEVRLLLAVPGPTSLLRRLVRGSAAMIPRRAGPLRLDGWSLIRRMRRLGLRVDYWVVNEPGEARELVRRGATGVVSDDPARVAAAVHFTKKESETL